MAEAYLVLGATGGIGRAVVKQLVEINKSVTVLSRSKEKAEKYFSEFPNVKVVFGDASNYDDVTNASQNCTALFYCVNTPYDQWTNTVRTLLKVSIDACVKNNVKLIFPGNVYSYGYAQYNRVDEMHPKFPHTKK